MFYKSCPGPGNILSLLAWPWPGYLSPGLTLVMFYKVVALAMTMLYDSCHGHGMGIEVLAMPWQCNINSALAMAMFF